MTRCPSFDIRSFTGDILGQLGHFILCDINQFITWSMVCIHQWSNRAKSSSLFLCEQWGRTDTITISLLLPTSDASNEMWLQWLSKISRRFLSIDVPLWKTNYCGHLMVNSRLRKRYSKAKRRAPAYSPAQFRIDPATLQASLQVLRDGAHEAVGRCSLSVEK